MNPCPLSTLGPVRFSNIRSSHLIDHRMHTQPAIPARSASVAKERQQRRCLSLGGPEARGLYERLHADAKLKEVCARALCSAGVSWS